MDLDLLYGACDYVLDGYVEGDEVCAALGGKGDNKKGRKRITIDKRSIFKPTGLLERKPKVEEPQEQEEAIARAADEAAATAFVNRQGAQMPPSDIPFYSAYTERKRQNEQQGVRELQKMGTLAALHQQMQEQAQSQQLRETLAQSGGDIEKAMAAAVQSGNLAGAAKLAPILETQRKSREIKAPPFRTITRGAEQVQQELRPDGSWSDVGGGPRFAPEAQPEIVKLQRFAGTLPEGSPGRQQLDARIQRLSQGEGGDRPFGAGATGGALDIMTRLARGYAEGVLPEQEARLFDSAVTHYTQPRTIQNPDTGLIETRRPELPPFVAEAMRKRGQRVPATEPNPFLDQPQPTPRPRAASGDPREQQTVWGLAPLTTGPVPAVAETLGRTPLVGEVVRAPQFTQARNFVPSLQRDLVRVLQNNPRYAEGERRAIESEININPSMFDTSGAFRDRLVGIDRALQIRERNAFETANSGRVGREERVQAMNVLNALTKFRQSLGVPPTVRNDHDWQSLQPGTEYVDPDGRVRTKR